MQFEGQDTSFITCRHRIGACKNNTCRNQCGLYDGPENSLLDLCVTCNGCTAAQHLDPLPNTLIFGTVAHCQMCLKSESGKGCGAFIPKKLTGDDARICVICGCRRGQHILPRPQVMHSSFFSFCF